MVSFVVPVYNSERWLEECVRSILAQTGDFELILVDDGSTDSSAPLCDRAASADSRVRVLHTANRGPSAARNAGVEVAKGEYVTFVDADDTVHPLFLQTMTGLLESTGADAAICRFTDKDVFTKVKAKVEVLDVPVLIRRILYQDGYDCSLCGRLFPAAALRNAPLRDTRYEDLDCFYCIYEALGEGAKVASTSARLYHYRTNPHSFIHNFSPSRLDVLDVVDRICEYYTDSPMLASAARDRRFSACCNMFVLASRAGANDAADRCWQVICRDRHDEIRDPRVRMKNKVGAALSHLGRRAMLMAAKAVY